MNLTLWGEIVVFRIRMLNKYKRMMFYIKSYIKLFYMQYHIAKRFGNDKVDRGFRLYTYLLINPEKRRKNRMALLQHVQELADAKHITFSEAQEIMEKCGVKF